MEVLEVTIIRNDVFPNNENSRRACDAGHVVHQHLLITVPCHRTPCLQAEGQQPSPSHTVQSQLA